MTRRAVRPTRRVTVLALVALAPGCGDGLPPRPDPAKLATLPPEAQCRAVAPRLEPCLDELILASIRDLGDDELTRELTRELAEHDRRLDRRIASARKAHVVAVTHCLGSVPVERFVAKVIGCWDRTSCADLGRCLHPPAPTP